MSRLFTKNLANYMSLGTGGLGAVLSGRGFFSIHAKIKIASTTTGATDNNILNVVIDGTTIGLALNLDGTGGTPKLALSVRSVNTDARQVATGATTLTPGVTAYVGGTVDVPDDIMQVYLNGVRDAIASPVTLANLSWTLGTPTAADTVGGYQAPPTATADQFNGEISEIAIWATILSVTEFATLATGAAADTVNSGALVYYLKIGGTASPELPTVGTAQGTITGSLPASSPIQLRPNGDVSTGSWTATGSATLSGAIDDVSADDADYITSALVPVNDVCEVALLDPSTTAAGTTTIVVRVKRV